jgi:hypothetical protein
VHLVFRSVPSSSVHVLLGMSRAERTSLQMPHNLQDEQTHHRRDGKNRGDGDTASIPARRRTVRGVNFVLAAGLVAAAIGGTERHHSLVGQKHAD